MVNEKNLLNFMTRVKRVEWLLWIAYIVIRMTSMHVKSFDAYRNVGKISLEKDKTIEMEPKDGVGKLYGM